MNTGKPPETLDEIRHLQCGSSLNSFAKGDKLGNGAVGNVYTVRHKRTRFIMAMKEVAWNSMAEDRLVSEILLQRDLRGFFYDEEKVYIILQLAPNGTLYDYLEKNGRLSDISAAKFMSQVAMGVSYLHDHGIIHRDLKPENLLLDSDMNILISDFGWSVKTKNGDERETAAGTPMYLSPEQTISAKYTKCVDVWCLGVFSYELLAGLNPFEDHSGSYRNLGKNIRGCDYRIPYYFSSNAVDFIGNLLKKNPNERMKMEQIITHPWIRKFVVHEKCEAVGDKDEKGINGQESSEAVKKSSGDRTNKLGAREL